MDTDKALIVLLSGLIILLCIIKVAVTSEIDGLQGEYDILTTELEHVQKDTTLTRERYLDITSMQYINAQAKQQGFVPAKEYIYLWNH